jgi:hypothetical protein
MQLMLSRIGTLGFEGALESLDAQRLQSGSPHTSAQPAQASQQIDLGMLFSKFAPLKSDMGIDMFLMAGESEGDTNIDAGGERGTCSSGIAA